MFTKALRILEWMPTGMNTTVAKQCGLSNQKMFIMNYFDFSRNSSYGEMILPLSSYHFLICVEALMIEGLFDIGLRFYYRIYNGRILEFVLGTQFEHGNWSYAPVGRFQQRGSLNTRLLEQYLRKFIMEGRYYYGLNYAFHESPVISRPRFHFILDDIISDLEIAEYTGIMKRGTKKVVRFCQKKGLELSPTTDDHIMKSKCPAGNHHIMINIKSGSWFCGYCGKKGSLKELKKYIAKKTI